MAKKIFEEIKPWDGSSGTGQEARIVVKNNFEKVNEAIEEIEEVINLENYMAKAQLNISSYNQNNYTKLDGSLQPSNFCLSMIKFPIDSRNKYYIGGVFPFDYTLVTNCAFIALYNDNNNLLKTISSTQAYNLAATLGVQQNNLFNYNNTLLTDWLEEEIPAEATQLSVVNGVISQYPLNNLRLHVEEFYETSVKDFAITMKEKQDLYTGLLHVLDMFITESFVPVNVSYTDGIVVSPVNVVWADGATGNIRIVSRDSLNNITQAVANHILNGVTTILTMTITRDSNGNVTNVTIA